MIFHEVVMSEHKGEEGTKRMAPYEGEVVRQRGDRVITKTGNLMWAGVVILLFIIASFVAFALHWEEGKTVFLNMTNTLTAASIGAFLGERMALS